MIRNLKALGLALVALLAMSAVAASAASAQSEQGELTSETGEPVTLTGTEFGGETENRLTAFGTYVQCPGSEYTGHKYITYEETTHKQKTGEEAHTALIPNKSTTATITPHYKQTEGNCTSSTPLGIKTATVNMTGCDYVFHVGNTTPAGNKEGTYGLTVDIECPPEKHIDVTVYNNAAHTETLCKITVKQQTGLTGFHVTNKAATGETPKDYVQVSGELHSIHVEREGTCLLDGKGKTTTEGKFDANVTVKAHDALGEPVGITVTDLL